MPSIWSSAGLSGCPLWHPSHSPFSSPPYPHAQTIQCIAKPPKRWALVRVEMGKRAARRRRAAKKNVFPGVMALLWFPASPRGVHWAVAHCAYSPIFRTPRPISPSGNYKALPNRRYIGSWSAGGDGGEEMGAIGGSSIKEDFSGTSPIFRLSEHHAAVGAERPATSAIRFSFIKARLMANY